MAVWKDFGRDFCYEQMLSPSRNDCALLVCICCIALATPFALLEYCRISNFICVGPQTPRLFHAQNNKTVAGRQILFEPNGAASPHFEELCLSNLLSFELSHGRSLILCAMIAVIGVIFRFSQSCCQHCFGRIESLNAVHI
jgi:hypothetical protein